MLLRALVALVLSQPTSFEIGEVDLYGQTGLDEADDRKVTPFHPGQTLTIDEFSKEAKQLNDGFVKLLGKPATDIAPVFYDVHHKTMMSPWATTRRPFCLR
jgi:hypothetical protein